MFHEKRKTSGEKALTTSQVDKLLSVITNLRDLGLIKLALTTGIRRGDIVKIKTKDVNLNDSSITFYEHKKRANHTVYISDNVKMTLEMIIDVYKSDWLFPSSRSAKKPMGSKTAYNVLQYYLKRADISSKPFHALRGTCAKLCQKKGWAVERTARLLNDTIKTVQGHYTTPSMEEMKETVKERPVL